MNNVYLVFKDESQGEPDGLEEQQHTEDTEELWRQGKNTLLDKIQGKNGQIIPQGSILGLLYFNIDMLPLPQIWKISYHSYADDTHIHIIISPRGYGPIKALSKYMSN